MTILERIAETRRKRLRRDPESRPVPAGNPRPFHAGENRFLNALAACPGRAVIAEIKMGSPRLGRLTLAASAEEIARSYARHGAAALSVVVEPDYFFGEYALLRRCAEASGLPAVAKDFVVDPLQILWAGRAGAAAVLLIASLLTAAELLQFAALAREHGIVPLVETHDEEDMQKLAGADWELVGINNRDLRTFELDLDRSAALLPRLPAAALKVAESGIHRREDFARLSGFDAFLVGESLLTAPDPGRKLAELLSCG